MPISKPFKTLYSERKSYESKDENAMPDQTIADDLNAELESENRTTELREKLTERGIEWTPRDSGFRKITYWKRNDGKPVYYADAKLGILCMTCTPDQAIAATLGSGKTVE